jgi:hypothetical protein
MNKPINYLDHIVNENGPTRIINDMFWNKIFNTKLIGALRGIEVKKYYQPLQTLVINSDIPHKT